MGTSIGPERLAAVVPDHLRTVLIGCPNLRAGGPRVKPLYAKLYRQPSLPNIHAGTCGLVEVVRVRRMEEMADKSFAAVTCSSAHRMTFALH
jgi:hypothetical protein